MAYLSTENIRRQLVGQHWSKSDHRMAQATNMTRHLLIQELCAHTEYPINTDVVIIDSTGLNQDFRQLVLNRARETNYNVVAIVFDLKNTEDHQSDAEWKVVHQQVMKLRKSVLSDLRAKHYNGVHIIDSMIDYLEVLVINMNEWLSRHLNPEQEYLLVGDVHCCVDELKALVEKVHNNTKIVLLGDYIDKGQKLEETLDYISENINRFHLVRGNHELFAYKCLTGISSLEQYEPDVYNAYFNSTVRFLEDKSLADKFLVLYEQSHEFFVCYGRERSFYATHSPVEEQYVGKLDEQSKSRQIFKYIDSNKPLEEQIELMKDNSRNNYPLRVCGHVNVQNYTWRGDQVLLDTGCINGNKLTGMLINPVTGQTKFLTVPFKGQQEVANGECYRLTQDLCVVTFDQLDERERERVEGWVENQICFVSETVCPANKEDLKLESLAQALKYYQGQEVSVQPLYSGSRCQVYLDQTSEYCMAVGRDGNLVEMDMSDVYGKMWEKFGWWMLENEIQTLIIDGVMLPWLDHSEINPDVIEKRFRVVSKGLEEELKILKATGFDQHLDYLVQKINETDFVEDHKKMNQKELQQKYRNQVEPYECLIKFVKEWGGVERHIEAADMYHEQVNLVRQYEENEFHPFSLLKIIYTNGSEEVVEWENVFEFVSEDEHCVIDLGGDLVEGINRASQYFEMVCNQMRMDGVVVKPNKPGTVNQAASVKVRNRKYMSLVYGYDYMFETKLHEFVRSKNIGHKLKTSINEHRLAQELLKIPRYEITMDNRKYLNFAASFVAEERGERTLDSKL